MVGLLTKVFHLLLKGGGFLTRCKTLPSTTVPGSTDRKGLVEGPCSNLKQHLMHLLHCMTLMFTNTGLFIELGGRRFVQLHITMFPVSALRMDGNITID